VTPVGRVLLSLHQARVNQVAAASDVDHDRVRPDPAAAARAEGPLRPDNVFRDNFNIVLASKEEGV
jgi:hypothetical protein